MAFQTSVLSQQGFGVVGELWLEGPLRAQPGRLNTGTPANNVVGRATTVVSGGTGSPLAGDGGANPAPLVVAVGGAGVFAGIIANPKVYPGLGTTAGGTLAASTTLPNGHMVELVQECAGITVTLPAAASVGDWVWFLSADGTLVTTAPAASAPAGANAVPIGKVERFTNTGAGPALVSIIPIS